MKYNSWKIPNIAASASNAPPELVQEGYPPLLATVLTSRGFGCPEKAGGFLGGDASMLHDPMLMADMQKAVERINLAAERGEHVAVYGDYDVDGITSSCLMTDCIRSMGLSCELYIPDRIEEGYGLNTAAIDQLHSLGVQLIITVDCGVTGVNETLHARNLGIDMVITDHHECGSELPAAAAVVNPKRPDCAYPVSFLAGVGVAFKLACALSGNTAYTLEKYADLVAIGTIADVMPMLDENRFMIREGLQRLLSSPRPGLSALIQEAGIEVKRLGATGIGFSIAPRLNAAGRLGRSDISAELLLSADNERCTFLAQELCQLNRDRQSIEMIIWEEAMSILEENPPDAPIVLAGEGWHQGVVGIAASRLAEAFSLPAIIICLDGEKGKGSCRSFGGFNLFEALRACDAELESFGGHALAAGLNIRRDKISSFRNALDEYYKAHKPTDESELIVDVCIGDGELLDMPNVQSLENLEPCGSAAPRAVLCMTGAVLEFLSPIGGGKHSKLRVKKFGMEFDCVFFSQRAEEMGVSTGDMVDVAFFPQINEFRGRSSVQLLITAIRPTDDSGLCRRILAGEALAQREAVDMLPSRADFVRIWKRLLALGSSLDAPFSSVFDALDTGCSNAVSCLCLSVFEDIGLLNLTFTEDRLVLTVNNTTSKVNLEDSGRLRAIRALAARSGNSGGDR